MSAERLVIGLGVDRRTLADHHAPGLRPAGPLGLVTDFEGDLTAWQMFVAFLCDEADFSGDEDLRMYARWTDEDIDTALAAES